jgi:RNA polymerase sigma-70 factor, ECF subfamily
MKSSSFSGASFAPQGFQELSKPDVLASRDESPYERFARMQRTEAVRALVGSLPAMYREVVMLRELKELTILEIAERLRCAVPTVKTRLFRGRSMLLAGVQKLQAAPSKGQPGHRRFGL